MRALPPLLLIAALLGGSVTAWAQGAHRRTLADQPPEVAEEGSTGAEQLLARGRAALDNQNFALAAQSYCLAAHLGHVDGQYRLGRLLLQQRNFPRAQAQARFVLQMAAEQGHTEALLFIREGTAFSQQAALRPACLPAPPTSLASAWMPASFDPTAQPVSAKEISHYLAQLDEKRQPWAKLLQERAPLYGIDPRLAVSIVRAESNFDPNAQSQANALGLMQLMPATAQRFGVRDPQDPAQNIEGGLAYLRWLLKRFDHDVVKTTAAYNAGEGAVDRYQGVPPYPETQAYVERILHFYRAARHKAPPSPKAQRITKTSSPPRS